MPERSRDRWEYGPFSLIDADSKGVCRRGIHLDDLLAEVEDFDAAATEPDPTHVAMLADHLDSQSRWRDEKAEEHPEDRRNQRSAAGLADATTFVLTLTEDDPRIRRLAKAGCFIAGDVFSGGERVNRTLSQWHFHGNAGHPDDLLTDLADAAEADLADLA